MELKISTNLSSGSRGDDVARLHQALAALGRSLPALETDLVTFGTGTATVVAALQQELGVPATGIIDATMVRLINGLLDRLRTDTRVVRGSVRNAAGEPFGRGFVQLSTASVAGEQILGTAALQQADGSYTISYQPPAGARARLDLRVAVRNDAGVIETTPPGDSLLTNAGLLEVVDFVLSGAAHPASTEYEVLLRDLGPLLAGRALEDITENADRRDVSLLSSQSGYAIDRVMALVRAHRLARGTGTPPAVFYGMLRQALPADAAALDAVHPDVRLKALTASVEQRLVPREIAGKRIEDYLPDIVPAPAGELARLLGPLLTADEISRFVAQYRAHTEAPETFWRQVAADPSWSSRAPAMLLSVQLGVLTNIGDLAAAVQRLPDVKQASDLVRLTESQWRALVETEGVGVPSDTPGTTADEKTGNYVRHLLAQVEGAFPTSFLAHRLPPSPVAAFLKAQPAYDLRTTYPERFFKQNPVAAQVLEPSDRHHLRDVQRIYRLTRDTKETLALLEADVRSAEAVAQMDRVVFAKKYSGIFPAERANDIHDRAQRTHAVALALFAEHAPALNRTGLQALPRLDSEKQASLAEASDTPASISKWADLFGPFDLCACQDCASVHGPAAYFVDILQFLEARGVRASLFARRPDLGEIELSCENANTLLSTIDLNNEVLEDAVAPPPPFARFTLAPALAADLVRPVATPALRTAFTPPLRPGARIETIEADRRWRVWDEPFAYVVVKDSGTLTVIGRSRQTCGPAATLRTTPQYRNDAAYEELKRSVYPWTLPFDLAREEAAAFLNHLGVPRHALIEALRPTPEPFDADAPAVTHGAAERLGLSDVERRILVGEALIPPRTPADFWGGAAVPQPATVAQLLERTGLAYAQAKELLETWFVNPTAMAMIAPDPADTCDPAKHDLIGVTPDVLSRLHLFVRLWRRLAWTIQETDQAIRVLGEGDDSGAPMLSNEVLVRVDHLRTLAAQVRLPVLDTLALWTPIDTSRPGSLYWRLFYNPAVFKPQDDVFRLNADGDELAQTDTEIAEQAAALQAAFRLDADALALLIARLPPELDARLNRASLSFLYQRATLARQLGLPVRDLLTLVELTGLDPFQAALSHEALAFVETVREVRSSGFSIPHLDYLLRHRASSAAAFVPADAVLARTLTDIRARLLADDSRGVVDAVSAALTLPSETTERLLDGVRHQGVSARQQLAGLASIDVETPLSRDLPAALPHFEILEQLLKVASVIQKLQLPGSQLAWLFRENVWLTRTFDPTVGAVPFKSWFSLVHYQSLRRNLALGDAAVEAILSAIGAVATAADPLGQIAAKRRFVAALSSWVGWPVADVDTLIGSAENPSDLGVLAARIPDDFRIDLVTRVHRAMTLLKRLGTSAAQASLWCEALVTPANAKSIREAAKGKHDEDAWQKVAAPLQDALRERQRDALVSYLIANPQRWGADADHADARALYAHFLIDVEMSACQLTSRIKQVIGSVQLYAQRCVMGLEGEVSTEDGKWGQWTWMKQFRVWEANRLIWLYPENWIEPELRDDKTPLFKELENELLQSELTDAAAELAFRHYLEQLDVVARLQIVGTYEDDQTKDLHVFARTWHTPPTYFHQRRHGITRAWDAWEKVDLDIEGDHLIPIVWNGRLFLVWPIFIQKANDKPVVMPQAGHALTPADQYWAIQLAWSERLNGRWSGKSLSGEIALKLREGDGVVLDDHRPGSGATGVLFAPDVPIDHPPTGDPNGDFGDFELDSGDVPSSTGASRLIPKELFLFKGLVDQEHDQLVVRGFLRRDYRRYPTIADTQIACCFGEFRLVGCRKLVTTAPADLLSDLNFPLAPRETLFDHNWFTGATSGLTLFDGIFPASVPGGLTIAGDPEPTIREKQDIPVLGATPNRARLLAAHQERQFVCDRPFFFMDTRRAFLVTSTGSSGKRASDHAGWLDGDLTVAWRANYFPPPAGGAVLPPVPAAAALPPFTVLLPGPDGRRIAAEMEPVTLQPAYTPKTVIPKFWTTRQYSFVNFHHPYLCRFIKTIAGPGVPALLSLSSQSVSDPTSFAEYLPDARVTAPHPIDEVEFQIDRAYAVYNWELFFHAPLLIADQLSKNQRFEAAQRWFHFIFDPTGSSGGDIPQRYWKFKPFFDRLAPDYEAQSVKTIEETVAKGLSPEWETAIADWRNNAFSPHRIARLRPVAYQKTVVMKYLDNLVAWGDQLFRRETLESINEATQLYVLAAEILGRRPEVIQRHVNPSAQTFDQLSAIGLLGNTMKELELLVSDVGEAGPGVDAPQTPDLPTVRVLYFCVPENHKLLGYWTTVADRLFKIRHCMNIEGQVRQLPLFEPPIDPALLVRAAAAGLSISDALNQISAPLPNYRFSVMLQKANELAAEVRNFGAALLSAIEKRDAEELSTLRSAQEVRLIEAMHDVRRQQVEEAKAGVTAVEKSGEIARARKTFYESREGINRDELASLITLGASGLPMLAASHLRALASILHAVGSIKFGPPTTAGLETGPSYAGDAVQATAAAADGHAAALNLASQLIGRKADYGRRKDDWDHQANLATIELTQIDQQLIAAQIRLAIAEQELRNHELQIVNARDTDKFLHTKFSNQDLYKWMIGQISGLYFRSYQLALDVARRAERCFRFELGIEESAYIGFGYWDNLKQGLLAGDRLHGDLRRLEVAYLERNRREFELTKYVSLALLDPLALVRLRETGQCFLSLPEEIFDLDYPGHYFRRIKSVSLTMPCTTGPYMTLSATLRLVKNSVRVQTTNDGGYSRITDGEGLPAPDPRFVESNIPVVSTIATSSGQNDSGVFELSFRDERYLPFEGAGVVSDWSLELVNDATNPDFGRPLRQFDYDTISDAILHVKYTAREGAGPFKAAATAYLREYFSDDQASPGVLALNLRRDFPSQWSRFLRPTSPATGNVFELEMSLDRFPWRDSGSTLIITSVVILARCTDSGDYNVTLSPPLPAPPPEGSNLLTLVRNDMYGGLHFAERDTSAVGAVVAPTGPPMQWKIRMTRPGGGDLREDPVTRVMEVEDVILVIGYAGK